MASFNKVVVMGNLTRNVELRHTPNGTAVCELGLAVNRSWFTSQSKRRKEEATFIDITMWGRQAEVAAEFLSKGSGVLIEERLKYEQWTELKFAASGEYDYILIDIELPANRSDARADRVHGYHLLEDLYQKRIPARTPVMIMDSRVACLNYVADYLKKGARGFAAKNPTDSHLLAKAIRGTPGNSGSPKETSISAGPFSDGLLKIYDDRSELLDIRVMADTGYGRMLKVLRTLSVRRNGRYVAMSLSELAEAARFESQNSLTGCIRRFRNNCSERLLRSHQVVCGRDDVLLRNEQGYQLASWIKVQIMDSGDGTARDTGAIADGTAVDVDLSLNERQRWVLSEIEHGEHLQRSMLEEHFEVSPRTAKRDLIQLRDRGLIAWVRDGSGGYYRMDSSSEPVA